MLIEMRYSCDAAVLVGTAYLICQVDGDDRRVMPFHHEQRHAILKVMFDNAFFERGGVGEADSEANKEYEAEENS